MGPPCARLPHGFSSQPSAGPLAAPMPWPAILTLCSAAYLATQEERLLDNPDIAAVLDLLTAESNEVRHPSVMPTKLITFAVTKSAVPGFPLATAQDGLALLSATRRVVPPLPHAVQRVRLAVVRYVHLDNEVLSQLLNYTRDRAVKVAAAVYDRLRTSVPSPEHLR